MQVGRGPWGWFWARNERWALKSLHLMVVMYNKVPEMIYNAAKSGMYIKRDSV